MMNGDDMRSISIAIGDQTFRIRAAPDEAAQYQQIAQATNKIYQEILNSGVALGGRALAMLAFQLAVELDIARRDLLSTSEVRERLSDLIRRIDQVTTQSDDTAVEMKD